MPCRNNGDYNGDYGMGIIADKLPFTSTMSNKNDVHADRLCFRIYWAGGPLVAPRLSH